MTDGTDTKKFTDRLEAAPELASRLRAYAGRSDVIMLGLTREPVHADTVLGGHRHYAGEAP